MVRLDYLVSPMNPLGGRQKERDEAKLVRISSADRETKTSVSLGRETRLASLQDPRRQDGYEICLSAAPIENKPNRPAMELESSNSCHPSGGAPVALSDADDVPLQTPPDPSLGL